MYEQFIVGTSTALLVFRMSPVSLCVSVLLTVPFFALVLSNNQIISSYFVKLVKLLSVFFISSFVQQLFRRPLSLKNKIKT